MRHLRQAARPRAQDQGRDLGEIQSLGSRRREVLFGPSPRGLDQESCLVLDKAWRSSRVLSSPRVWTKSLRHCLAEMWEAARDKDVRYVAKVQRDPERLYFKF